MNFKNLFDDERAVSPVIGVILMVAITVILAAVIGTFVLGLGDQLQETSPQASFGFDTTTVDVPDTGDADPTAVTAVEVSHQTGDVLQASNLNIVVNGAQAYGESSDQTASTFTGEVTAGTTTTIVAATDDSAVTTGQDYRYNDTDEQLNIDSAGDGSYATTDVGLESGDTVRVVWSSDSGGSSSTLGKFTLP